MIPCGVCGRIAPRNEPLTCCYDCQADDCEARFLKRLNASKCKVEMKELLTRWWRRPIKMCRLAANPYALVRGLELQSLMAVVSTSEEGNAIHFEDVADPPAAKDERPPGAVQLGREAALEIAHQRLGIRSPTIRFTDPVPMSSLRHLPFSVAVEIQSIGRRHDRRQDKNVRAAASQYRAACQALRDPEIVAARGEVLLKYAGRHRRLLRYGPDYPSRGLGPSSGRAVGCTFTILSEDEKSLQKEIDHFHERHRESPDALDFHKIMPSARRFTRANSHVAAPEDRWSVVECFITRSDQDEIHSSPQ